MEGTEVSPRVLLAMLDLVPHHQVEALIYSEHTARSATERVREAAQTADIGIIAVGES